MQKTAVLDQTTLCADGSIDIKFLKVITDDGGNVLFSKPHRTAVDALGSVDDQIAAVNIHLAELGFPPVLERLPL
ncbi:hypothetical protein LB553_00390 [Mesorhizobium sp. CA8]|uniref:hypothetical protein n=1 Tax=Mesorhizobium sp. CA8 TaxID=2876637 RepID=UPI001CCD459B|nr:hypothetical protein [Mesorhizobium sp. CA8]MBZ9759348.1 hypothetical protein [Mesorhizobium sp. CA8]